MFVIEYILNNLFLPGKVENYVVIIDVNNLGVSQIPKATLGKVISCLSKGYKYRTKRMFVLNTSFGVRLAWKVMESFMAEHTRKKMQLSDKNTTPDLIEAFHPSQLEQKYGGTAKNVTSNYWPPIMPSSDYGHDEDDLMSEGEYEELMNKNTKNQEISLGKY